MSAVGSLPLQYKVRHDLVARIRGEILSVVLSCLKGEYRGARNMIPFPSFVYTFATSTLAASSKTPIGIKTAFSGSGNNPLDCLSRLQSFMASSIKEYSSEGG